MFDKSKLRKKKHFHKLTESDVRKIAALLEQDYTQRSIAEAFDVSAASINSIARGRIYRNITGLPDTTKQRTKKGK